MLKAICEACGKRILEFCAASGKLTLLLCQTLRRLKDANWHEVVRQMALLGADSLPIVLMTILCTGMVFSVQTAKEFVRLGASSTVGGIVAIAMARELVPVLVGVVVAGRIGAAIAAELGTMKVTEQMPAAFYPGTDLPRLHNRLIQKTINNGGLPHTTWSCHCCGSATQQFSQSLYPCALFCTDEDCRITARLIDLCVILSLIFHVNILLIKTYDTWNTLLFHHNQKTIQQIKTGPGLHNGKNHHRLINICDSRPDQPIAARQQFSDVPQLFFLIQHIHYHIIADQRLSVILTEDALRFTLVHRRLPYPALTRLRVYIVEPGNSFDNLSLHTNILLRCEFDPSRK